jgi:hypothetical protein
MAEVTKSELARRLGVSPSAVGKAIRQGRIAAAVVTMPDGRELLDEEKAVDLWARNTLQKAAPADGVSRQPKLPAPHMGERVREPVDDRQLRAYIESLPEDQIPDLNDSRARREHYQAEVSKLAALQGRGELVVGVEVERKAFELARAVRDQMTGIPDRVSGMLAACGDARKVHQMLSDEIRIALGALTNG